MLNLPHNSRGLQDVLFGKDVEYCICRTDSKGLDVLVSGQRNGADALDLISHRHTGQYIRKAAQDYDHVIIDTPPILAFSDALFWARMSDAVVLTCFVEHTLQPDLLKAIERMEQIGAKVIGTVVNNVKISRSYHYYRYGYGYGYGAESKKKTKIRKHKIEQRMLLAGKNQTQETKGLKS